MADYQFLTDQDKADIVAAVMGSRPAPDGVLLEHEKGHFRSVIEAKLGLHDPPDDYTPPDTTVEAAEKVVLETEAAKLPPPTVPPRSVEVAVP